MPPKKVPKAAQKQVQKTVEDKTFGLKNKKGKKQQTFIKQVETSAAAKAASAQRLREQALSGKTAEDAKKAKEAKKKEQEELARLFKPVQSTKVPQGVDPKSVLCSYYKQGLCMKGAKCKFSHDMGVERKAEKRNMYSDETKGDGEKKNDSMEDWDQATLEEMVNRKYGSENANRPTAIICKHFLDAVEKNKYGWFWECPNGGSACKYRHALPPGYVLKREKKKADSGPTLTLEELIETERNKLGSDLTMVTLETFTEWKAKRTQAAIEAREELRRKDKERAKTDSNQGISGRDLFEYNPDLFVDDESAMDQDAYERDEGLGDDEPSQPSDMAAVADEVDEALFEDLDDLDV